DGRAHRSPEFLVGRARLGEARRVGRARGHLQYGTLKERLSIRGCGSFRLLLSQLDKVAEQKRAFEGEEALGVELNAVQRPGPVSYSHDLALGGPGGDQEVGVGERLAFDHQAVVAGG